MSSVHRALRRTGKSHARKGFFKSRLSIITRPHAPRRCESKPLKGRGGVSRFLHFKSTPVSEPAERRLSETERGGGLLQSWPYLHRRFLYVPPSPAEWGRRSPVLRPNVVFSRLSVTRGRWRQRRSSPSAPAPPTSVTGAGGGGREPPRPAGGEISSANRKQQGARTQTGCGR